MASRSLIIFFFVLLLSFSPLIISAIGDFGTRLDPKVLGLKKEKLTYFKLFWHDFGDIRKNATAVVVVNSTESSFPLFGQISIYDDPLTLGPELTSKEVGRSQGFYAFVGQTDTALLQAQYFHFTEGKYNGSSLIILGRNAFVNERVREMPIIGGTGIFRLARGYVEIRTYQLLPSLGEDITEYNVYVLHC